MGLFDLSLGPLLLGTVLNVWLYGIMCVQTAMYYTTFKFDYPWVKIMVAYLFIIDTLNSAFDVIFLWRYTISLFGNLEGLLHSHWSLNIEPVMTVMISSTTQSFFAWRIIKLTGQKWLGCTLWVLAFTQLVAGAIGTVGGFVVKDFARFRELKVPVTVWLGTGTVTDVLITGVLIWYLHTHRTGYSKTDDVITKLIRLTMQTGLIVTIWATINLFLYLFLPEGNNVYLFFQLPLCKLYTNTLMSTLNARVSLREELTSNSNIRSNPNEPWTSSPGPSNFRVPTVNQASTKLTVQPNNELEEYGMGDTKWAAAKDIETLGSPHLGTAVRLSSGA